MPKISKTILIVDDDDDDKEFFQDAARQVDASIRCINARDGEDALNLLNEMKTPLPDYIFLDLNMPRIDGKECLRKLKSSDHLRHIPVIIYTTTKREEDVEYTRRLGALHFLTKPTRFADICSNIAFVLGGNSGIQPKPGF